MDIYGKRLRRLVIIVSFYIYAAFFFCTMLYTLPLKVRCTSYPISLSLRPRFTIVEWLTVRLVNSFLITLII